MGCGTYHWFQTDPCGVEASLPPVARLTTPCFRRTLVGSKQEYVQLGAMALSSFQTDPCGVEATRTDTSPARPNWFQTDPCGVEARARRRSPRRLWTGFRRTLVGSKRARARGGRPHADSFQTDPCGVEARPILLLCNSKVRVSDGPLWGRSFSSVWLVTVYLDSFRRTLVGSKP